MTVRINRQAQLLVCVPSQSCRMFSIVVSSPINAVGAPGRAVHVQRCWLANGTAGGCPASANSRVLKTKHAGDNDVNCPPSLIEQIRGECVEQVRLLDQASRSDNRSAGGADGSVPSAWPRCLCRVCRAATSKLPGSSWSTRRCVDHVDADPVRTFCPSSAANQRYSERQFHYFAPLKTACLHS